MSTIIQDLRYAMRMLIRSPGFTTVAVLTLALGTGANTAIFSVVNALLLKPLPFRNSTRLVMVWEKVHLSNYQNDQNTPSPGNYADWKKQNAAFDGMAAIGYRSFNLVGSDEPMRVEGEAVSSDFFSVLEINPFLGRVFTEEEDRSGARRVVLLGYGLWASRFGADPQILGKSKQLDDESYTVVGVMPEGFRFPDPDDQVWVPLALAPAELANHSSHYLRVVARLKPGVSIAEAKAQMDAIGRRLTEQYPTSNTGVGVQVISLHDQVVGNVRPALLVIMAIVGLILLIVCANIANLFLARATVRRRELAIRMALGAGRYRVIRQLLTECVLLSLVGGSMGLLLAFWGVDMLRMISPPDLPRAAEIGVDGTVLAFSLGISLGAGILIGLVPAFNASRDTLQDSLKEGARESAGTSRRSARNLLVTMETALGVVVLVGAGLLLRSFLLLQKAPLGFQPQRVLTFRVIPRGERYSTLAGRINFYQQALQKIETLPGVKSAAAISFLPLTFTGGTNGFTVEGHPPPSPSQLPFADFRAVTPNYFRTMEIPLLNGRDFTWTDTPANRPSVIINQAMAQKFWPMEDPLGKRIKLGLPDSPAPWLTVIGVVANVREFDVITQPRPGMYLTATQDENARAVLRDWVVRASSDPTSLVPAVRSAIGSVDKYLPISRVKTMEEVRSLSVGPQKFNLLLVGLFASLALVLTVAGLYGVTTYSVAQRTHEIGIRMALGARPRDVFALVLSEGAILTAAGLSVGVAAALGLAQLMRTLLYGVSARDLVTFLSVGSLLAVVAFAACYLPARRAARVDPMEALRYE